MDKMNKLFGETDLLAKKIMGQLTEQEEELFNKWLNSSKRNQILFEKLSDRQNFLSWNSAFESMETEQAWESLERQAKAGRKAHLQSFVRRYAAAVLLLLTVGTGFFLYFQYRRPANQPQVSAIQPGMRSARLILNNGENINLEAKDAITLREADGTVIEKTNEELNYTSKSRTSKAAKTLQNTLVVPRGGEYSLVLSDGSRVSVNSMSKLVFPVQFAGNVREVYLEGEAYFEVEKDAQHPFLVNINSMQIEVLGTSFNVNAYQNEQKIYTTLIEGSVKISLPGKAGCLLSPDQQAVFDKSGTGVEIREVDASQYIQWASGKYAFTDQPLGEIMKTLSRWYDFTYRFEDDSLKSIRFGGGLNKYENIDPILEIIEKTGKVKVSVSGKEILFER